MQAHVENAAHAVPGIIALLSTTITANKAMLWIFKQQGYTELCKLAILPLNKPRIAVNLPRGDLSSQHESSLQQKSFSSLNWRPCQTPEELTAALLALRQHRRIRENPCLTENELRVVGNWLPGEYEALPADCKQVADFITNQQIWILHDGNENLNMAGAAVRAVLFMGAGAHAASFAGIVVGCYAAFEAAVAKAQILDPSCERVYVDRCESFRIEDLAVFGEVRDYVVMLKWWQTSDEGACGAST